MKSVVVYLRRYEASFIIFILFFAVCTQLYAQNTISVEKTSSEKIAQSTISSSESQEAPAQSNTTSDTTAETQYSTEEDFPIFAEDEENAVAIQPIGFWDTVRVFVVLGLVILGIYVFVWFLKKFQSRSFTNSDAIQVLTSHQLAGGGNVHLIKLGKSLFFIGASNQNVTLMKEIHEKEEIDEIDLSLSIVESEEENTKNSFYQKIKHIFKKGGKKASYIKEKSLHKSNLIQDTFEVIKSLFGTPRKTGEKT